MIAQRVGSFGGQDEDMPSGYPLGAIRTARR
jgi:hypothetical protein